MATNAPNCTLQLDQTNMPKLIGKVEFFMFRAIEKHNIDYFSLIGPNRKMIVQDLLKKAKEQIIPEYIDNYVDFAKRFREQDNEEQAQIYEDYVLKLTEMLALWDSIVPNFIYYSSIFTVANKFTLDNQGLVDVSELGDDEERIFRMMNFDLDPNEVDPLSEVDKVVELYLRSLIDENVSDNFTNVVGVNYNKLVQELFHDLRNSYGLTEIINKLRAASLKNPVYSKIADRLESNVYEANLDVAFKIRFQNTFSKAYVPIHLVSVEKTQDSNYSEIKVMEATKGSRSLYEKKITSNFFLRGMEVATAFDDTGKPVEYTNLAEKVDGTWTLTDTSIKKIKDYIEKSPKSELKYRQIEVLKGIGLTFADASVNALLNSNYLGSQSTNKFKYIYEHLLNVIEYKGAVTNPYDALTKISIFENNKKKVSPSKSQATTLSDIIKVEMTFNNEYTVEHSVLGPEGKRQYAIQLHNNITLLTKQLNDYQTYPKLQDLLTKPNMFWLDPQKNRSMGKSWLLNSLFYMDVNSENYGERRRVVNENGVVKYSSTSGEYARIDIVNTGGMQYVSERIEMISQPGTYDISNDVDSQNPVAEFKEQKYKESEAKKTQKLSDIEKLLQDLNSFIKVGYNSFLRLGDKSTDLGYMMNYYFDPVTGMPAKRPLLGLASLNDEIYNTDLFRKYIHNALIDIMELKYLNRFGFMEDLQIADKNIKNTYAALESILSPKTKAILDDVIKNAESIDNITIAGIEDVINNDINNYFSEYIKQTLKKFEPIKALTSTRNLVASGNVYNTSNFDDLMKHYLMNSFIMDMEQMTLYFGDVLYFKTFHKRSSKDSATGVFANSDQMILDELNAPGPNSYAKNNNLQARLLLSNLRDTSEIDQSTFLSKVMDIHEIGQTFNSAVLKDVMVDSEQGVEIQKNMERLIKMGYVSKGMEALYRKSLARVIDSKYKNATESDGQGKCTFDFYRIMSLLTNQWGEEQEKVYEKIIMYSHYDNLAENAKTETERFNYIQLRDAVKYDPTEPVYFPPKKFQYSGPMEYIKKVLGEEYTKYIPIFDKFSLQPLIPTITKNTPDDHLLTRMLYNNIGYVKFASGTKVERLANLDSIYEDDYNQANPGDRTVKPFNVTDTFKSKQTLYLDNLKEQVLIDAEIHNESVFGSQIRKLIMMNIERSDMKVLLSKYNNIIDDVVELEKNLLYRKMGIEKTGENSIKVADMERLISYFLEQIDRKNQSNNVRKALKYDEATKTFEIPLDAAVQSQILEGIVISAINNNIVRYKTNGSMLVQVSTSGTERIQLSKSDSEKALKTLGNRDLAYYMLEETEPGKPRVRAMEVKIALTGQWLKLLSLTHPDGFSIQTLDRLNESLQNADWKQKHEKSLQMVAYRIPTQGINFMDVMTVKEFLPAAFGDAIIMPSEIVIKSGSDFDIDKMFVFYPNLDRKGKYVDFEYNKEYLNTNLEQEKKDVVFNLKHWKNYRDMTLLKLQTDYNDIKRELSKEIKNDTKTRAKLDTLVRQVNMILMMMNGEDREIRREFNRVALRNNTERDDSRLSQMISDNIIFNLDEYETYKKEKQINVLNPLNWIDTKREGLNTLLQAIGNLQNKTVDELQNAEAFQQEVLTEVKEEMAAEIAQIYAKLYKVTNIKANIQNKMYDIMAQTILHPSNYLQLVTPSDNFVIMPIIDNIYLRLGKGVEADGTHKKTDYKNTEILNRGMNADKFLSLLRSKSDLGIAAVANTFNVLFQIAKATGNPDFFIDNNINTYFNVAGNTQDGKSPITRNNDQLENILENIDYSGIYDEDGNLKSEFFSEFISAFVDAANDDYVFTVNVVTELSPIMFYMKYMGLSSKKILYFVNQPIIRKYIQLMMQKENMFLEASKEKKEDSIRNQVISELARSLGYQITGINPKTGKKISLKNEIGLNLPSDKSMLFELFSSESLENSVRPDNQPLSSLTKEQSIQQLAMLQELLNLRQQSSSLTEIQKTINFDTAPYASSFDVYERNALYNKVQTNKHVLNKESVKRIRENTMITPLNVASDIQYILDGLFKLRNSTMINNAVSLKVEQLAADFNNKAIRTSDDKMRMARVMKNDFINYILQNYFQSSSEGVEYFKEYFKTEKTLNQYLGDLVTSPKMIDNLNAIRAIEEYDSTDLQEKQYTLVGRYPIVGNIFPEPGEQNPIIKSFRVVAKSNNVIDQNDYQEQFERLVNIEAPEEDPNPEDYNLLREFFRDLALYSIFQSGMNYNDLSYVTFAPVSVINKIYGYAVTEFFKQMDSKSPLEKTIFFNDTFKNFYSFFAMNNREFYGGNSKTSIIKDVSKRGKWYFSEKPKFAKTIGSGSRLVIIEGTKNTKEAARNNRGIYSMRPKPGDNIPGIKEIEHFGNPWSAKGGQEYYENLLPVEGETMSEKIANAVANYDSWIRGTAFQDVQPKRREWINTVIEQGRLFGKVFLYFKSGYKSHAHALVDYINERAIATENKGTLPKPSTSKPSTKPTQPTIVPKAPALTTAVKPKGEEVKDGIYLNQAALTKEEQLELFDYLKPFLEEQAAKTNKGVDANKMIGLGLRWDYISNNPNIDPMKIGDVINPANKTKFGYYALSINGKPLGQITDRFRKLVEKATGVDMTYYDGAIINLYEPTTFISSHNDVDESKSAAGYPVVGINIGGTGNFSIESRDGNPKQLDLKAGSAYVFGVGGKNRAVYHRTFPKPQDSFLPKLTTKIDGKTYEAGSYRITITMRRVMPLEPGMPSTPAIISTQPSTSIKGINISTKSSDKLGRELTNPNWGAKNIMDIEAEYKANASKVKAPELTMDEALRYDMNLMYKLQMKKFKAHPELVQAITDRGGVKFLEASEHTVGVGGSRWEGKGTNSNFIKVLIKSYQNSLPTTSKAPKETITSVKPGVEELFDSSPELANQVYEALGFKSKDSGLPNLGDLFDNYYEYIPYRENKLNQANINRLNIIVKTLDKFTDEELFNLITDNLKEAYKKDSIFLSDRNFDAYLGDIKVRDIRKKIQEYKEGNRFSGKDILQSIVGTSFSEYIDLITPERKTKQKEEITPQQKQQALQAYSQYLDTIFPDSKVKDIVYRGDKSKTINGVTQFLKGERKDLLFLSTNKEVAKNTLYYSDFSEFIYKKDEFGNLTMTSEYESDESKGLVRGPKNFTYAIVDIKNPLIKNANNQSYKDYKIDGKNEYETIKEVKEKIKNKEIDALIVENVLEGDVGKLPSTNIGIKNPEQIHILGNKEDVEGFKRFVSKSTPIQSPAAPVVASTEDTIMAWMNKDKVTRTALLNEYFKELKQDPDLSTLTRKEYIQFLSDVYEGNKVADETLQEFLSRLLCK